jgi:hypothetical protein
MLLLTHIQIMTQDWNQFFSSLSDHDKDGIALIRIIECSNGCIQHAFREEDPRALSIEQTRDAMKYSMSLMKTMDLNIGGVAYEFSESTKEKLKEIRELYIKGFKQNNSEAMNEFFKSSYACVKELGMERLNKAADIVKENLSQVFPSHTIDWGYNYLNNLRSYE